MKNGLTLSARFQAAVLPQYYDFSREEVKRSGTRERRPCHVQYVEVHVEGEFDITNIRFKLLTFFGAGTSSKTVMATGNRNPWWTSDHHVHLLLSPIGALRQLAGGAAGLRHV